MKERRKVRGLRLKDDNEGRVKSASKEIGYGHYGSKVERNGNVRKRGRIG